MVGKKHPFWSVGKSYLVRTVTMIQVGRLSHITDSELVLCDAAWIADTGRFYNCLKDGTVNECEPFPNPVLVSRGAIVDATEWTGELPLKQR